MGRWIVVAMLAVGCAAQQAPTDVVPVVPEPVRAEPAYDGSARVACRDFRNIMGDAFDGLLTDSEFRDKLVGVHENARLSDNVAIGSAVKALLAVVTSGGELAPAVVAVDSACDRVGL